jgi:hypothetical protein
MCYISSSAPPSVHVGVVYICRYYVHMKVGIMHVQIVYVGIMYVHIVYVGIMYVRIVYVGITHVRIVYACIMCVGIM